MSQLNVDKVVSLAGGGGTAQFQLEASGNFNFDSGTLYVDSSNNRIGVNDASPSFTLDITVQIEPLKVTHTIKMREQFNGVLLQEQVVHYQINLQTDIQQHIQSEHY